MKGVLDKITQEVELEGRSVTISCNGWELELSLDQSKQLIEFLDQIGNDICKSNGAGSNPVLTTKNIEMENYIGLILDERNDHYTIGYRQTSNLQKLKEWKKEMLKCSNVTDCKILKVEEIN